MSCWAGSKHSQALGGAEARMSRWRQEEDVDALWECGSGPGTKERSKKGESCPPPHIIQPLTMEEGTFTYVFSFLLRHLGPPTLPTPGQICSPGFSELRFIQLPLTSGQDVLL